MVDAITSPTVTIPAATPSAAGAGGFAGAGAGGDFQTFLTMLTLRSSWRRSPGSNRRR